jgi:Transposase DDE domain
MDPASLPEEIAQRQELKAKLEAARHQLEERHRQEFAAEVAHYDKKKQKWENNDRRGHEPKPPASSGPDPKSQSNLTDPDSRIMRKSKNEAFAQAYNAQLAVDADGSQLVLGAYVSQSSADNNELEPMLEAGSHNMGQKPEAVLADRGYINGPMIEQIQSQGIEAYVALSAKAHERPPYDLRCEDKRRENPPGGIGHRYWWRWNKSCELRKVAAAICAAKPVSNQSLGLLRRFWVLSSSLCAGYKKLPWSGTWSVWLTI